MIKYIDSNIFGKLSCRLVNCIISHKISATWTAFELRTKHSGGR